MKSNVSSAFVRVLPAGVLLLVVAGLSGCSSNVYNVKVDAIQNPEVSIGYSYRIVPASTPALGTDMRQVEAVEVVKSALACRGMYEAPDPARAEVEVFVRYGVGPQRLKVESSDLAWQPTVARAPLALVPLRMADGSVRYAAIPAEKLDCDGTYRGVHVLRGSRVCEKYLTLSAREAPGAVGQGRRPAEAWQVHVSVEDGADSLDGYLPILAEAAIDYLGTNSDGRERVVLREDAPMIAMARAGR